jgi:hypothetical protein
VNADDLDDTSVKFGSLKVQNAEGAKLGTVDGFIIDVDTARPYYVVVDSGGWFKSKYYLVPVGHARLGSDRGVMLADLTRDRIKRFPGFDKDEFEKLSDLELEQFAQSTTSACCVTDIVVVSDAPWCEWHPHYEQPDWWQSNYYRPDRAGSAGVTAGAEIPSKGEPSRRDREPAMAHDAAKTRRS